MSEPKTFGNQNMVRAAKWLTHIYRNLLTTVNGTNPKFIHEFYSKLVTHVQALETMGKLNMINGYVRTVLDRLPGIRSDIVRHDDK